MPVIRVEVPDNTDRETMLRIRQGVKQAVLDTLAPKETKYDYVAVSGVVAEIGDGVPLIAVDLRPGREVARKKALVRLGWLYPRSMPTGYHCQACPMLRHL